jgi:hypothetical protein
MRRNSRLLIVGAVLIFGGVSIESQKTKSNQEQTHFSAEDAGVSFPVPIPDEALAILRRDDRVENELAYAAIAPEKLPRSWFSASEIALGSPGEKDLIVVAEGPLLGANVDTFWVFVNSGKGYLLVLTIPAHDLIVKRSRTNGYRNLEAMAATAITVTTASFRFDGHQYREYSEKTEDIK